MAKMILTDSYFNLFPLLVQELKGKTNVMDGKNLIFCEEKVLLMAERTLLSACGGTFNTGVYSFGNYLREKHPNAKELSKEGSAMVVKRILSCVQLGAFKASRAGLAPSLFDLIIQLKSAKVGVDELERACHECSGVLKNKIKDVLAVYSSYEEFIKQGGFDDQSSALSYLPSVIENDPDVANADVFIVGFNGWTSQLRAGISALLKNAKSVTAILVSGDNPTVYVGETQKSFVGLCNDLKIPCVEEVIASPFTHEGKLIASGLFNPRSLLEGKSETQKIYSFTAENRYEECESVAREIRALVMEKGLRYRDFTVAVSSVAEYGEELKKAFERMEIPCFIDEKKKVGTHPLIRLVLSYVEVWRKNMERNSVIAFFKNPLFTLNKELADEFENYILEYNINFSNFKNEFTFTSKGNLKLNELNDFRQKILSYFKQFDLNALLKSSEIEKKTKEFSRTLSELGEEEERAVNDQIYSKLLALTEEMNAMLGDVKLSYNEYRNLLLSGVSAMELSIIPQYTDAVFVGEFKQTALAKAECLFVLGLTSDVPAVREDVALLSDGDINLLEEIKVLVEPKIKIVNHRMRECVAMALSAFNDRLYVSYPLATIDGSKTVKSEVFDFINSRFKTRGLTERSGYSSYKDGLTTFARACGDFAEGRIDDFTLPSSFYVASSSEGLDKLLERSSKEVKIRLENSKQVLARSEISPTRLEDFYKCPYRAFLSGALRLKRREEGSVDGFSIGNFMHEIFCEYALKMNQVFDRASSDALVNSIKDNLLKKDEYARFVRDAQTDVLLGNALRECSTYCYKNYLAMRKSKFKVTKTEATIGKADKGKKPDYSALSLCDGLVKMTGKIDRVDESDKYFRILDYKTVSPSADVDLLFKGKKLQLYLYARAVQEDAEQNKELAGVYYMPVNDEYRAEGKEDPALTMGATLDVPDVLTENGYDSTNKESMILPITVSGEQVEIDGVIAKQALSARIKYAKLMAEQAIKEMREGVIVPSPCDNRICSYCDYRSICDNALSPRTVETVDDQVIIDAVKGGEE